MKRYMLKAIVSSLLVVSAFCVSAVARGWTTDGSDWFYYEDDENISKEMIRSSGDDKYYLDENGYMVRDYLLEDYNGAVYYFDESGKMVTSTWVAVDTTQVQNGMDNPPSIYLYYFGTNGKAFKSNSDSAPVKKTIDGKKYLFNGNGQMLSGWINEAGERYDYMDTDEDPFVGYCYYAGDETDGVLREGWSSYEDGSVDDKYYLKETLWFYFKPGNCKKECSTDADNYKTRTINGKKYGFDVNGVMIQGWESDMIEDYGTTKTYFSEDKEEDERGRMYKNEWVFAVPSKKQCETDATDTTGATKSASNDHDEGISRWFYSLGSGEIVKNSMRKINSQYYVFNKVGIMKSGLCIIDKNTNRFVDCIDTEKTDGKDFIMSRHYISMESYSASDEYHIFDDKTQKIFYFIMDEQDPNFGMRKLGEVTVPFADNDYTFGSQNTGQFEELKNKKYYQAGILLKAEPAVGLGLVLVGYASSSDALGVTAKAKYQVSHTDPTYPFAHADVNHKDANGNYIMTNYIVDNTVSGCQASGAYPVFVVVDGNGKKVKKTNGYSVDKAGHYWLIGPGSSLIKIFDVPIKYSKQKNIWYFRSEVQKGNSIRTDWIAFKDSPGLASYTEATPSTIDVYGKECYLSRDKSAENTNTYETYIDDTYATNFRFIDQ